MQQTIPTKKPQTGAERFLAACRHQQADATPIWFMRQAGRCLADYRALRQRYGILEMAKTPELSTQVTLMPVQKLGVDAAVLYADIMLPIEEMGMNLEIEPDIGPIIHNPIRSAQDIAALRIPTSEEITPFVMQAIRLVKAQLAGKQAVIGFSGAPYTLACYMIEGRPSRDYGIAKSLMYGEPLLWHALMEKLTDVIIGYLRAQVNAGADALQIFDSWVGALSPSTYKMYVQPYMQRIFTAIKEMGVPSIHFGTGAASLLELMVEAGGDVISVDWRMELDQAWERIGFDRGIQGNLDPTVLLTSWSTIETKAKDILRQANNRPGHIFNLGHGVLAPTDPALLRELVDLVHEQTQRN